MTILEENESLKAENAALRAQLIQQWQPIEDGSPPEHIGLIVVAGGSKLLRSLGYAPSLEWPLPPTLRLCRRAMPQA